MSKPHRNVDEEEEEAIRHCSECGGDREHEVSVTVTESDAHDYVREENEEYARQPHRIYECIYCGHTERESLR
jgi:transcription elongation factor Elf1